MARLAVPDRAQSEMAFRSPRSLRTISFRSPSPATGTHWILIAPPHQCGTLHAGAIKLLETFPVKTVIAIENVRLFQELEARTQQLAQSVGKLRALGDVGRVSSTLDLEKVLPTISLASSAFLRLRLGVIYEYDESAQELNAKQISTTWKTEALREYTSRRRYRTSSSSAGCQCKYQTYWSTGTHGNTSAAFDHSFSLPARYSAASSRTSNSRCRRQPGSSNPKW